MKSKLSFEEFQIFVDFVNVFDRRRQTQLMRRPKDGHSFGLHSDRDSGTLLIIIIIIIIIK